MAFRRIFLETTLIESSFFSIRNTKFSTSILRIHSVFACFHVKRYENTWKLVKSSVGFLFPKTTRVLAFSLKESRLIHEKCWAFWWYKLPYQIQQFHIKAKALAVHAQLRPVADVNGWPLPVQKKSSSLGCIGWKKIACCRNLYPFQTWCWSGSIKCLQPTCN